MTKRAKQGKSSQICFYLTPNALVYTAPPPSAAYRLLEEGRDVSLRFDPTTKDYYEDLNGKEVALQSGLDESLVYKFNKKVVKKSEVREGGGSFSIRIEIDDHANGPAVLEYTARNTNRLMNQVRKLECEERSDEGMCVCEGRSDQALRILRQLALLVAFSSLSLSCR